MKKKSEKERKRKRKNERKISKTVSENKGKEKERKKEKRERETHKPSLVTRTVQSWWDPFSKGQVLRIKPPTPSIVLLSHPLISVCEME